MQTLQIQEQTNEILNENKSILAIPKEIQNTINTRGFYIYEWIGTGDLKNSIENDFLNIVHKTGGIAGIILIVLAYLSFQLAIIGGAIYIGILLFSLLIMTIYKAKLLFKNSYVIITDKGISLNNKITYYENLSHITKDIDYIGKYFQEEIFKPSMLSKNKGQLINKITQNIKKGYAKIYDILGGSNSRESGQGLLIGMGVYTIYVIALIFSYFISSLLFLIVGVILSIFIKQMFKLSGNKEIIINDLFDKIDTFAIKTENEKNSLKKLLDDAIKNDWQDGLLNKINNDIANISKSSAKTLDETKKLKSILQSGKYSEIFNYNLFNSWVRTQIIQPLMGIETLLSTNIEIINNSLKEIELQIQNTNETSHVGPLELSKKRQEITLESLKTQLEMIQSYITKLNI